MYHTADGSYPVDTSHFQNINKNGGTDTVLDLMSFDSAKKLSDLILVNRFLADLASSWMMSIRQLHEM